MVKTEHACDYAADAQCGLATSSGSSRAADALSTYSVSTWDHDREGWDIRYPGVTKWEIRRCLRQLYSESWDNVSILVQRNE